MTPSEFIASEAKVSFTIHVDVAAEVAKEKLVKERDDALAEIKRLRKALEIAIHDLDRIWETHWDPQQNVDGAKAGAAAARSALGKK